MPIPADCTSYRATPVFDAKSLPAGLRRAHTTAPGVWAKIHVLEGELLYVIEQDGREEILKPGDSGVVEPQVLHHVEPLGDVRVFVEFFRQDGA